MEKVINLVENSLFVTKPQQSSSDLSKSNDAELKRKSTELSVDIVCKLWHRMTELYGYKWSTPMGEAMIGDDLSLAAQTWRRGLSGFTKKDIGRGFAQIMAKNLEWPPSLLEFRKLCMTPVDAPSLQDVISTLVNLPGYGTLVDRYKHPMVLAVAMKVDMFAVRTARGDRLNAMIKPVYERLVADGWDDWPAHAGELQKSLDAEKKPVNRDIAMASLAKMRELL